MVKHLKVEQSDGPKLKELKDERVDGTRPDRPSSEELEEESLPIGFESEFREKMEFFDGLNYARKRLRNAKETLEKESGSK